MTLSMGIVKIEIKIPEFIKAVEVFKKNNQKLFELNTTEVKSSASNTLNQVLREEFDLFLGQEDQKNNVRVGANYKKKYSEPQTPLERVLASPSVAPDIKEKLRQLE